MRTIVCPEDQVYSGPLLLVNREHPLRPGVSPVLEAADRRHPAVLLESRTARVLTACLRAAGAAGDIVPVSGWRSRREQQEIWDDTMEKEGEAFTRQYVALPGCSEHETGLAIDLGRAAPEIDFIRPDFPYDGICGAFRRLAARFGFVERYGQGKEDVTGIAHEPWHFRYVGSPHAQLMADQGLCLEEYLSLIRQRPQQVFLSSGRQARVFYVPCAGSETRIRVPEERCTISGDNVGGFVVAAF